MIPVQAHRFSFLFLVLFVAFINQISAQSPIETGAVEAKELEEFLEPIFSERMNALHIPGAVFVFVKDGQILFAKGYGSADKNGNKPVLPDRTLFQIGSITKLFTATAVMQLVEQNKLNLHEDVNRYLTRFQIESRFNQPVTLHHLLTHTGGFEDRFIGTFSRSASEQPALADHLAHRMPSRVMPPGLIASYSNHGMALAGHIIEQASGLTYDQYLTENILKPLQMQHSASSLSYSDDSLSQNLATAYDYREGSYQPIPRGYYGQVAPAASVIASGTDMANFMIAHLQRGRFGNVHILSEATTDEMHKQQFTHHPRLPGWTYGFQEEFYNGRRLIGHGGGARGYMALLILLPDENTGFFVACNASNSGLQDAVFEKLLNRYYPSRDNSSSSLQPNEDPAEASKLTGSYRYVRQSRTTLEKMIRVMEQVDIRPQESGKLTLGLPGAEPIGLTRVEPLLYQRDDGKGLVSFRLNDRGQATHLFLGEAAAPVYEKLNWYESLRVQIIFIIFFIVVFLSAPLIWLIPPVFNYLRKKKNDWTSTKKAKLVAGIASLFNLVFLIGFPLNFLSNQVGGIPEFFFGLPIINFALLFLPIFSSLLTFIALYFVLTAWQKSRFLNINRIYYTIVALANLGFIPFLLYWNLLGFWY